MGMRDFIPHKDCSVMSGECFLSGSMPARVPFAYPVSGCFRLAELDAEQRELPPTRIHR